jgi:hypothetical protein
MTERSRMVRTVVDDDGRCADHRGELAVVAPEQLGLVAEQP